MRKLFISTALIAFGTAFAGQASAQTVTGTVNLTGSVGVACRVVAGGTLNGSAFGAAIALNELANGVGALRTIAPVTVGGGAGANNFQVNCTGATVTAAIGRTLLETAGVAPAGYASKINYVAAATVLLADGTSLIVDTDAASAPTASSVSGARVRVAPNNILITVSTFVAQPDDGPTAPATALLVAGNYAGAVTLTLTPTT